jgi:membrane peptidoglycan carboxypeptidase
MDDRDEGVMPGPGDEDPANPRPGGREDATPPIDPADDDTEDVEPRYRALGARRRHPKLRVFLIACGVMLVVFGVAAGVLWQRCGLNGCPDVERLSGYMPDEASVVLDREGREIGKLFVTRRVVVPIDSIPEEVQNAFIAIEDRRFWSHGGVDWRRVLGAMWQNVKSPSQYVAHLRQFRFPPRRPQR